MATSTSAALSGHPLHVTPKSKTAEIIPIAAAGVGGPFEPTKSNQRILPLKIRHCGVRRHNKIDHPDRPETTEGHHGDHYTDDIGPDQRREDQGQRAARTPRCRPRTDRRSVNRSRDGRARDGARQQDAAR